MSWWNKENDWILGRSSGQAYLGEINNSPVRKLDFLKITVSDVTNLNCKWWPYYVNLRFGQILKNIQPNGIFSNILLNWPDRGPKYNSVGQKNKKWYWFRITFITIFFPPFTIFTANLKKNPPKRQKWRWDMSQGYPWKFKFVTSETVNFKKSSFRTGHEYRLMYAVHCEFTQTNSSL